MLEESKAKHDQRCYMADSNSKQHKDNGYVQGNTSHRSRAGKGTAAACLRLQQGAGVSKQTRSARISGSSLDLMVCSGSGDLLMCHREHRPPPKTPPPADAPAAALTSQHAPVPPTIHAVPAGAGFKGPWQPGPAQTLSMPAQQLRSDVPTRLSLDLEAICDRPRTTS